MDSDWKEGLFMEDMPTERFLRRQDVEGLVGLKHSALYRWMKTGDFPAPSKTWCKSRQVASERCTGMDGRPTDHKKGRVRL